MTNPATGKVTALAVHCLATGVALADSAHGPSSPTSIFSPVSTPAQSIYGLSLFVLALTAAVEIVTGLALFSHVLGSRFWTIVTGWPLRLIDIQHIREIHFLVMFTFWMFFFHHLYSAMLVSKEEKTGVMESIFSGYKFIREEQVTDAQATSAVSTVKPASMKA